MHFALSGVFIIFPLIPEPFVASESQISTQQPNSCYFLSEKKRKRKSMLQFKTRCVSNCPATIDCLCGVLAGPISSCQTAGQPVITTQHQTQHQIEVQFAVGTEHNAIAWDPSGLQPLADELLVVPVWLLRRRTLATRQPPPAARLQRRRPHRVQLPQDQSGTHG